MIEGIVWTSFLRKFEGRSLLQVIRRSVKVSKFLQPIECHPF
jgi:hypothetical protein